MLEGYLEGRESKQMGDPKIKAAKAMERLSREFPDLRVDGVIMTGKEEGVLPRVSLDLDSLMAKPENERIVLPMVELREMINSKLAQLGEIIKKENLVKKQGLDTRKKLRESFIAQGHINSTEK